MSKRNYFNNLFLVIIFSFFVMIPFKDSYCLEEIENLHSLPEKNLDIATIALTLAKEFNPSMNMKKHLKKIDEIVNTIKTEVKDSKQPQVRLNTINNILYKKMGFSYDLSDPKVRKSKNRYLNGLLDSKKGSCITLPLLYLIVGQRLNYPIYPVIAPSHLFLRYINSSSNNINIEATSKGKTFTNSRYIRDFSISKQGIQSGAYMREMTYKEYLSELVLINAIRYFHDKKDYDKAFKYIDIAQKLRSLTPEIYRIKSKMHFTLFQKYQREGKLEQSNKQLTLSLKEERQSKKLGYIRLSDKEYLKQIKTKQKREEG